MIPALELRGISKRFGPVQALEGADFVLRPGEVHALLGENGAGKSTLMHIASGHQRPDQGAVFIKGVQVRLGSPREAARHGIGMVHQHFSSIPAFTAMENIALAARWPMRSPREVRERVDAVTGRSGLAIDPEARTETLGVILRQRIEILKALATDATILLFDEPTGTLAPPDALDLLRVMRQLAGQGSAVVLITHRLDEALAHADWVTVLRRGRMVFTGSARGLTGDQLATYMLGHAPENLSPPLAAIGDSSPAVRADRLSIPPFGGRGPGLREATFEISPGEVVGLAAVEGSGQHELLRCLAGLMQRGSGELEVQAPVSFIPEDRTTEGLIQEFSLAENMMLGFGQRASWVRHGVIDPALCEQATEKLIREYQVRATGALAPAATLSGGNQQRFMLARALAQKPRVLLAEQPARGLDIQASRDVYQRLRAAAGAGAAVLLHSNDLDELLAWCDRLVVLAGGYLQVVPPGTSRDSIGRMMLGSGLVPS
ncbi:MAG: ATP-binding cassette domain-containing protein [Gemmatimonadota bacterium]